MESPPYNGPEQKSMRGSTYNLVELYLHKKLLGKILLKILRPYFLRIRVSKVIKENNLDLMSTEIINFALEDIKKLNERVLFEIAEDIMKNNFSDELETLKIPVLVITGDRDTSVPFVTSEKLAKDILPNGYFVLMRNENHYVPNINPKGFCKHVIEFLK